MSADELRWPLAFGYLACRELPTGEVVAIMPMLFTAGLFCGVAENSYSRRYCYENLAEARAAMLAWDGNGDPPGPWIKEKPSDRLGPGAIKGGA